MLSPSYNHLTGVAQVYIDNAAVSLLSIYGKEAYDVKRAILSGDITEDCFDPHSLVEPQARDLREFCIGAMLQRAELVERLLVEHKIETLVSERLQLSGRGDALCMGRTWQACRVTIFLLRARRRIIGSKIHV